MSSVDVARQLANLEARVAAMERSNTLKHSSVHDATTGRQVAVAPAIISAEEASRSLAQVLVAYAGKAADDGLVTVFYGTQEPTDAPADGDLWLRDPDRKLLRYDGFLLTWGDYSDQVLASALMTAQRTADDKIASYWQPGPPSTGDEGDLWFETDNGNKPYRWTGSAWEPLTQGALASQTYVESEAGWALDDVRSEFGNINTRGDLGATQLAASAINLGGDDLASVILPVMSQGALAFSSPSDAATNGYGNVDGTIRAVLEFHVGEVKTGRIYMLVMNGYMQATNADSEFTWTVRYTTDGTDPTTSSAIMNGSQRRFTMPSGAGAVAQSFSWVIFYAPTADYSALRLLLCGILAGGTGTCFIYGADDNRDFQWAWIDLGFLRSTSGSDKVKRWTDGSTAQGDALGYYRRRYTATWTHNYDASLGTMAGAPPELYQGGPDDLRSLIGFDYTTIAADLATATIRDCSLIFRVKFAEENDGIDLNIGTHNFTSEPAVWVSGNVVQNMANPADQRAGFTYKVTLPNTVATGLQGGTVRGISIGPLASRGYLYPDPQLEISYERT